MNPIVIHRQCYEFVLAPQHPVWAATNGHAARLIQDLAAGATPEAWAQQFARLDGLRPEQAVEVVAGCAAETAALWQPESNGYYAGRAAYLQPTHLRELWVHINNRCNFSCRHCLVSSGPHRDDGLPALTLAAVLAQARELGVTTFYFTGGEPLLRPDLPSVLQQVLDDPDAQAVILTNGSLLTDSMVSQLRNLDRTRLHLQVSLDGSQPGLNDALRSAGAFHSATTGIRRALSAGLDTAVATVVLQANLADLPAMASLLGSLGVKSWHLMWQHRRERGAAEPPAPVDSIIRAVLDLIPVARRHGVVIDNVAHLEAVINGDPATKRDGTNAGWDSLAIYADGGVYPSAALVGIPQMACGNVLDSPLKDIWLHSPRLQELRRRSVVDCCNVSEDPFLFLHGGGDPEHAFFAHGPDPCARDPYLPLYRELMLAVADEIVAQRLQVIAPREDVPVVYHVMGQDGHGCPVAAGVRNSGPHRIELGRSNCVLIPDVVKHTRDVVQRYYGEAAVETKGEICCPVPVDRRALEHIPPELLQRSYGCGSPVFAANIRPAETVVDLGCGVGVECFAASRLTGPEGTVIGVDMTPQMLELASGARDQVARNLGYANVSFVRGYLEAVPLRDNGADLVISNCVVNLSPEKYRVFGEIFRLLRPGGRMVISDITTDGTLPDHIRFNPRLRGECLAGALPRTDLLNLLTKIGFEQVETLSELPWRAVDGAQFHADTICAVKPLEPAVRPLPYAGIRRAPARSREKHLSGCIVCGAELQYLLSAVETPCALCGRRLITRSRCAEGHFVCDQCHGGDYLQFLHSALAQATQTDPVALFLALRNAYPFPVHGPEHHALVPAAFLVAYHNAHGMPGWEAIWEAVQTGAQLVGGSCASWGACSAALGIGVAYGTILEATPLTGDERGRAQQVVAAILQRIAALRAPRCCRRESLIALQIGCELSAQLLPHGLSADDPPECDQVWANDECLGADCPFVAAPTRASRQI